MKISHILWPAAFLAIFSLFSPLFAQQRVWIFFTDKGDLTRASVALSPAAVALRAQKGISLDMQDMPVNQGYIQALRSQGATVLGNSRWLNAVAAEVSVTQLAAIERLGFVAEVRPMQTMKTARKATPSEAVLPYIRTLQPAHTYDYGEAFHQNDMLKVPDYHDRGFTGKGVRVAVFDAGFDGVDTIAAFRKMWQQGRILKWYDFVDNDTTLFRNDSHGTMVLSCIAAEVSGEMVGSAPNVSVYLCRTEQSASETLSEEYNWVHAMEWVDSLGVDIIHSSLGYSRFDDKVESHTYKQLDGNTTVITRAADLAARKGIIVTSSAGNEGDEDWHYISAPCDADSILCIGAVNRHGKRSYFSSFGPSADGRVKPDVVAMGTSTTVFSPANYVTQSNGTSFSGPIMAGFVACLKQAHPQRSHMDIIRAVRLSGDQFPFPDDEYGYGLPNILVADSLLRSGADLSKATRPDITAKPIRGAKPKPQKELVFTTNPSLEVKVNSARKTITVPNRNDVSEMQLMYGDQKVYLTPKNVQKSETETTYKVQMLPPAAGVAYYLQVKFSDGHEENIQLAL